MRFGVWLFVVLVAAATTCVRFTSAQPRFLSACSTTTRGSRLFEDSGLGILDSFPLFSEECESDEDAFFDTDSTVQDFLDDIASGGGTASTVEDDFNPFRVSGGDETDVVDESEKDLVFETNIIRPAGPWELIIENNVPANVHSVWEVMRNFGTVLLFGLEDFSDDIRSLNFTAQKWQVTLTSGEQIVFDVKETNGSALYHIFEFDSHTSDVFPGVDISGTSAFIQFLGDSHGTDTVIEFGWGGAVNGPEDVAKTAVGTLGQEILEKLEERFGQSCEGAAKNRRTIEGDCNNLSHPRRGAAGHALVRFGGNDPAFPGGDPLQPSGPTHISPRVISNKLCSQSPGIAILEEKASLMEGQCATKVVGEMQWEVCPFKEAGLLEGGERVYTMRWKGMSTHSDGNLVLEYSGEDCDMELMLTCGGTADLDLVDGGCGQKGNRFFHPEACNIKPGEDDILNNKDGLTDMFWSFGQFIDHDLDLTPVAQLADKKQPGFSKNSRKDNTLELPISVPEDDFFIKESSMEFERSVLLKDRNRGLHENQHSAYADLSQVYGVDYLRARALRSFRHGKLKLFNNLPPYNKLEGHGALRAKVDNAPDAEDQFFAVGDIRGNEQTLLLALHIVWIREHNLVCDELRARFPKWNDERLYQTARAMVIATYQSIVYDEWLPLLLGKGVAPSSSYAYNAETDASISAVFSTAAFRFGHTMVGSYVWKLGPGSRARAKLERVPLRDVFFKPAVIENDGIDPFLRGAAWHKAKEVDAKVVDELRNFLFTEHSDRGHMDLVSLNIQRGRDMGLPSFNQLRAIFGLPEYESFSDFIEDEHQAAASQYVYEDVDVCDAMYCGFAEKTHESSILGETFFTVVADQFIKLRDGDRFFFKALEWDPKIVAAYPRVNQIMRGKVKLADILVRNTGIKRKELGRGSTVFKI